MSDGIEAALKPAPSLDTILVLTDGGGNDGLEEVADNYRQLLLNCDL